MRLVLLFLAPVAVHAQLALFSFDGTTDTPVGATYNFGTVQSGAARDVRFHVQNTGSAAIGNVVIGTPRGAGFSIAAINGSYGQNTLAPQAELEFTVRFTAQPTIGTYSASIQITSDAAPLTALLLASVTPAPLLTVFHACALSQSGAISFPDTAIGSTSLCNFSIQNQDSQPVVITIKLTGDGAFQAANIGAPATLRAGDAITFSIQFTPVCGTLGYSATLSINGQPYSISANGLTPPVKPVIAPDTAKILSGETHSVSMSLPSPAICGATGFLNLDFSGVVPDSSIYFLSGMTRSLPYSVNANETQISIGGKTSATFETGTTAGTLTFSAGGASTSITIPPSTVVIQNATASNQRTGELDIQITGFDNTYSAGAMSFQFLDASGGTIASIAADAAEKFKSYFSSATAGSGFLMRISFPVQGDRTRVAKVQVTITNSAGQTQTSLIFQ